MTSNTYFRGVCSQGWITEFLVHSLVRRRGYPWSSARHGCDPRCWSTTRQNFQCRSSLKTDSSPAKNGNGVCSVEHVALFAFWADDTVRRGIWLPAFIDGHVLFDNQKPSSGFHTILRTWLFILTQIKDGYTSNSHCTTYSFLFTRLGEMCVLNLRVKGKVHFPNLLKWNNKRERVRISGIIIFHLSERWKTKFFTLCDAIFLVGLRREFEIDHSWDWKDQTECAFWTWEWKSWILLVFSPQIKSSWWHCCPAWKEFSLWGTATTAGRIPSRTDLSRGFPTRHRSGVRADWRHSHTLTLLQITTTIESLSLSLPSSKSTFSLPFKEKCIGEVVRKMVVKSSFNWVRVEKPSSSYCVMIYFWRGCRRNSKLITLGSERLKHRRFWLTDTNRKSLFRKCILSQGTTRTENSLFSRSGLLVKNVNACALIAMPK